MNINVNEVEENFIKIQEAYELLSDPVKRKQYDSSLDFDDALPRLRKGDDFFKVFGEAFRRNARFSVKRPVPELGAKEDEPKVWKRFYDFWRQGFSTIFKDFLCFYRISHVFSWASQASSKVFHGFSIHLDGSPPEGQLPVLEGSRDVGAEGRGGDLRPGGGRVPGREARGVATSSCLREEAICRLPSIENIYISYK